MDYVLNKVAIARVLAVDVVLLVFALLSPALFHAFGIGVHYLEPMRISLFAVMLFVPIKSNSYVFAALLPCVSCIITGMPFPVKAGMMSAELVVNVFVFYFLKKQKLNDILCFFASIIVAKSFYVIVKYMLIQYGFYPQSILISNVVIQFLMAGLLSLVFGIIGAKKRIS